MPLLKLYEFINKPTFTHDSWVEVGFWFIKETIQEFFFLYPHLEIQEQFLASFRSEKRKKEWLAVRAIHQMSNYGKQNGIQYTERGKPFLTNHDLHISISHTNHFALLAYSDHNIGVDIEVFTSRPLLLKDKFLNEDEISLLNQSSCPERFAVEMWTAKEAAFKFKSDESLRVITEISLYKVKSNENSGNIWMAKFPDGSEASVRTFVFKDFQMSICQSIEHAESNIYSLSCTEKEESYEQV